ncbi:Txe/YoeB family addiction module toxin [Bacteroidia bacterium]|nr:Txe/YoeB family addiction module toxin [Bacteroidia bacterium]
MNYQIVYQPKAKKDIQLLIKSGNKIAINKLYCLLSELKEHPLTGIGKPEQLKGALSDCYSRRITHKHRLVYQIFEKEVVVLILSAEGHYDDK